ncbi:Mu-like prophage protein Com [Giesbergeria anulus]|uniref:Mu-like prophage protein Com n=2 Tax=Giesbergeria anulus TaxID=180197 RepID=A0A1H9JBH7_9BURK|nr:Com family DNA-binding transcriptional regulator [Giesbergeria anulus]SEQ84127.1 Mu-like prophage protein Com [Giesbergeria anulus]
MYEIRCGACRKKLGEGIYQRLSIKCSRCGTFNQLSAQSAPSTERHPSVKPLNCSNDDDLLSKIHST